MENIIKDKVQGDVIIQNKEIEFYDESVMLSVIIDDHGMNITDIIQGDNHLTNAAKQNNL